MGKPELLTVLVFKDNHAARTFRVPLRWIQQFGWLLGALIATIVISLTASAFLFRQSRHGFPTGLPPANPNASGERTAQLESQVKSLQEQLAAARTAVISPTAAGPVTAEEEAHPAPIVSPEPETAPGTPLVSEPFLFRGLPEQIQAAPANVPITVTSPSARWEGKTLRVHFGVQYTATGGSQQGRILVLARGPGIVLSHPATLFQGAAHKALIDPNQGEYFSVSRFRDTHAEFGPISNRALIHEVEIVILSQAGQLLVHQVIQPKGFAEAAPAKPRRKVEAPEEIPAEDAPAAAVTAPPPAPAMTAPP